MDDGHTDDQTQGYEAFGTEGDDQPAGEGFSTSPDSDPWPGVGARRSPRSPAEGVRIIGAEEAAAAIESGHVSQRSPDDVPRFGDVPEPPPEPRPPLRFPGADPAAVAKPPLAATPPPTSSDAGRGRGRAERDSYVEESFWDDPDDRSDETWSGAPLGSTGSGAAPEPDFAAAGGGYAGAGSFREELERESYAGGSVGAEFGDDPDPFAAIDASAGFPGASASSTSDGSGEEFFASDDTGSSAALPHWTEPPSGENPRILPDSDIGEESDDDLKAWSTLASGPRWRDEAADWDDTDLASGEILDDPEMRLGALRGEVPDDDEAFLAEEPPAPPPEAAARRAPSMRSRPAPQRRSAVRPARGARDFGAGQGAGPGGGPPNNLRGHELQVRVVTGAIVLAVLLVAAAVGPGALTFIVAVALVMAAAEFYAAVRGQGYHPATLLGLAATAALVGVVHWRSADASAYLLVFVLLVLFSMIWYLVGVSRARPLENIAVTVMGFVYVGFLGSFAAVLLKAPDGIGLVLGAILATAAYDTGAYFVGAWTGRTPLMPHISPGKTVEGLVGGSFAALVMCLLVVRAIAPWDGGKAFWLALLVSVLAPLGDLCESMIKRDLGVKDMGALVRGHGGVLDRIDALLFVVPGTFYLFQVLS